MSTDAPAPVSIPPVEQTDTHQLDKLPDLPDETPFYKHPLLWIIILFFVSCAAVLGICGYFHLSETVSNAFIAANSTLHTVTAGMRGREDASTLPYTDPATDPATQFMSAKRFRGISSQPQVPSMRQSCYPPA